jgi:hypothetical protein
MVLLFSLLGFVKSLISLSWLSFLETLLNANKHDGKVFLPLEIL